VREVGSREAAQHFVLAEAEPARHRALRDHLRALWGGDRCRLLACEGCGLVRADPFVAGDATFYELAYRRTRYPAAKWEHRRALRALDERRPRTLLELGAGDGAFLRLVVPSRVAPADALATEYSGYGRAAVEALGVRCLPEDVRALPAALDGRFDAVCLFQVLEHLDGLDEVLHRIGRLTTRRAALFVAVPSAERVALHEAHGGLLDMPPNHLTRWTREALLRLGARHGWRLAEHEVEPEGFLPAARRLLEYRFLRAAQRPGSVPNRVRRLAPSRARRALDAAWLAATLPAALPALRALRRARGGDSQWARFEREG
jgi:SAM-dependent methyltransferase